MLIRKVQFKNGYKRFHDLTIDLGEHPARIIAMVGPNGCGKSSVLDGLLFHANAYGAIGSGAQRDYSYHSMHKLPSYDYRNVMIELASGAYQNVVDARYVAGKGETLFSFRSPYRYNNQLKVNETKATGEIRLNNYGARDASSIDAKMEDNYRRLYAAYNRYLNEHDVKPSDAKAKIAGDLNASIQRCLDLELSSIGSVEDGKGTLFFRKNDHPTDFEFNVLSSGEKEVVDILMDLYLRKDDYNDTAFLIDEPELHINTAIQRRLLLEINRLVGENCQIWITTHSVGFLRALQTDLRGECQIIQFKPEFNLASQARTIHPSKPTPQLWRELFAIALDDLAHLVSPKTIIYCEGRAEPGSHGSERGLDAKVYNTVFGNDYPETLFVSSGGNTELDQRSTVAIAVLGKVFPTVEIWVLKDRDAGSGRAISESDRQLYLNNNPVGHRMLKRWEIENYLYDKDVLKSYCAANALTLNEVAYDAFVTNIYDQNLKDETGRFKNFCGIKTSVGAEQFKESLAEHLVAGAPAYEELKACVFQRS